MSDSRNLIRGSIVAIVTPMFEDGSIDFASLENLIEYHIKAGTNAIVANGTTGESATLTHDESIQVILKTIEIVNGRIPVIAGTGSNSTQTAIEQTKRIEAAGAIASLSVVPYYNKPTQEGMYQHYKAIAESTNIDIILYNVPGRTAVDMQPETVARLAKIPNIVAIKEATGDPSRVTKILELVNDDSFTVVSGDDPTFLKAMQLGAKGVISVTNNIAAAEIAQICKLALNGDMQAAQKIDDNLQPVYKAMFLESNPIPVKWACYKLGLISHPYLRLPLTTLSEPLHTQVTEALQKANLLK